VRAIIDFLLRLYLVPINLSTRLARYTKGKILRYDNHFNSTLDVIRRYSPSEGMPVVDVGAYDGDSTFYLAKHLPKNQILGFEPNPEPFGKANADLARHPKVKLINIGFSSTTGEKSLFVTNDSVSSSLLKIGDTNEFRFKKSVSVKVSTLDDFFQNYGSILLIKLDVQGAELDILEGGGETIAKTRFILTEMLNAKLYNGACQYFEVDQFLRKSGFKIHSIFSDYNHAGTKYFDALYFNERLISF
jgi:FkbM family methyltransferase